MASRRSFLDILGRFGLGGAAAPFVTACSTVPASPPATPEEHFDLVVIGTGFGGTMTALTVAYTMENRLKGRQATPLRILMLERGTWWTTPTETLQDKQVRTRDFLVWKGQPTQEWSALADYRGMFDLVKRCRYSDKRPQGLYDFSSIGKRGLFNLRNDGVSVLRASGVGGGSLIYSKILIRPPETLFDDPRWPGAWRGRAAAGFRRDAYARALTSVTRGVAPGMTSGTGPSNIITRAPSLEPKADQVSDPAIAPTDGKRKLLKISVKDGRLEDRERELIDRARVFQTAIGQLTPHYGTVDLSINDMAFGSDKDPHKKPGMNFCERHGRCNVGCLPGAGQTLNKQLLTALYGNFTPDGYDPKQPQSPACLFKQVALQLRALALVDHIGVNDKGAYLVHYRQRPVEDPTLAPVAHVISADRVVVAAGSLGTSELMLRSRERGLADLSPKLGYGFSPNGDHIALLGKTKERVSLTYGPVTTSFGQFNPASKEAQGFHNVEDQGIPRSLAALTGHGFGVMQKLAHDDGIERYLNALAGTLNAWRQISRRSPERTYPAIRGSSADLSTDRPESEDELTATMMCVVAQGKDAANGQFRLEDDRLRVARTDNKPFHEDEIYTHINKSLDALAEKLRPEGSNERFIAPLVDVVPLPGMNRVVLTSHPLGGCPMAESIDAGVVDEWGRVYRRDARDKKAVYKGLYIADGSVIPTALGVNPALTISAVALHAADKILAEWDEIAPKGRRVETALDCKLST